MGSMLALGGARALNLLGTGRVNPRGERGIERPASQVNVPPHLSNAGASKYACPTRRRATSFAYERHRL